MAPFNLGLPWNSCGPTFQDLPLQPQGHLRLNLPFQGYRALWLAITGARLLTLQRATAEVMMIAGSMTAVFLGGSLLGILLFFSGALH